MSSSAMEVKYFSMLVKARDLTRLPPVSSNRSSKRQEQIDNLRGRAPDCNFRTHFGANGGPQFLAVGLFVSAHLAPLHLALGGRVS